MVGNFWLVAVAVAPGRGSHLGSRGLVMVIVVVVIMFLGQGLRKALAFNFESEGGAPLGNVKF